jgi:hypothetical protein
MLKGIGIFVGGLLLLLALTWVFTGNDFFLYQYFAPKQEMVRRQVFEETKSYNQGMAQELEAMMVQHASAKPEAKDAICSVVRHRTADYPSDRIPGHLLGFVNTCRHTEYTK